MGCCFGPPGRPCCECFGPGPCCDCCGPRRPPPGPMYGGGMYGPPGGMYGPPRGGFGRRPYYWYKTKVVKAIFFILYDWLND